MAFENKVLIHKDFKYEITLRGLLKEENEVFNVNGQRCFLIKTEKFIKFFRDFETKVRDACGWECPHDVPCFTHRAYFYLRHLRDSLSYCVENDKLYYKAFYFQLTNISSVAFGGWTADPIQSKCLKHLTYSHRIAYLK